MSIGEHTSLEETRRKKKLKRFIEKHILRDKKECAYDTLG